MRRLVASAGLLVVLAAVATAQDPPARDEDRNERLAVYLRTGRYADARRLVDEMLKAEPRDDLKNVRAMFGSGPNMRVQRGSASVPCQVSETGVLMPLTVNGKRVDWLVDTGANLTLISDAEASRLGLVISDSAGQAADLAGGSTGVRTATARHVVIGQTHLQNVFLLITPADQMPWKELPPGKQGILGLPAAIALDALRWTRQGMCHTGSAAVTRSSEVGTPNLRYNRLQVIATVEMDGTALEFVLDTGNQAGTQLWERFGNDFALLVKERGRKGTVRVTQIGGANDREVVAIPDLRLKVGGKETKLAVANLFSKPVGDDRFHGLLGMDVLSQAAEVIIDFQLMTLTLR